MGEIFISKPSLEGRKLTNSISSTKDLSIFIKEKQLFVEYEVDIHANNSVLSIPLTASMLPLAWLSGSDIYVDKLDWRFKESMDKLKLVFKAMYPLAPFTTEIIAEELVKNHLEVEDVESGTGLLFSGGVDSMYSLINNIHQKPRLVMIWGADNFPYPEQSTHWEKTISIYKQFTKEKDLSLDIVKTNITQLLDNQRIEHKYHKELYEGVLRSAISHSLVLLPIAAPLSEGRFNQLLIAASFSPAFDFSLWPRAAVPEVDEKIVWADLDVKHDGYITRKEKIEGISQYYKNNSIILRVCLRSELINGNINDNKCEKCLRTIVALALAGVDPNEFGFTVDEMLFKSIRTFWENRKTSRYGSWLDIQRQIPEKIEADFHGTREFFEWFRDFDFKTTEKNWFYTDLYMWLPYDISKRLDKVYRKLHIKVHESPCKRYKQV